MGSGIYDRMRLAFLRFAAIAPWAPPTLCWLSRYREVDLVTNDVVLVGECFLSML